ncbi:ecto-ADP-ribosyltransferase 4-like [Sebastes umbrosus]|uniref:ecto-ADP-ribosyltransferase 4-like n=1 Tax=Sebastes umbrosus TaxID=72105 RepID=UPI00189FC6C6|nr:ecto-ADP-ribosyltransferase 4-like [Sebastes umbrosus]
MPSRESQACQKKKLSACAITFLLAGLLVFVVVYLTLWKVIDWEDPTCRLKATVVTDKAIMQKWDASTNFSQAWSNAEQNAREPAHEYMEKHHSTAIYMYSNIMLQPVKQDLETAESNGKQLKETFEPRSLYSALSEAIQILKHSQVTCLSTYYRTETLLHPNISNKLIRFSTFVLGSDGGNFTRNASCLEVYTCFGADVTRYSALKLNNQVLIPPYEVFKVTDTQTDTRRCKVIYRLRSDLNCVYDRESDKLHRIHVLPEDMFFLIFAITCTLILCLLLPLVIVKVLENCKKTAVCSASSY